MVLEQNQQAADCSLFENKSCNCKVNNSLHSHNECFGHSQFASRINRDYTSWAGSHDYYILEHKYSFYLRDNFQNNTLEVALWRPTKN